MDIAPLTILDVDAAVRLRVRVDKLHSLGEPSQTPAPAATGQAGRRSAANIGPPRASIDAWATDQILAIARAEQQSPPERFSGLSAHAAALRVAFSPSDAFTQHFNETVTGELSRRAGIATHAVAGHLSIKLRPDEFCKIAH